MHHYDCNGFIIIIIFTTTMVWWLIAFVDLSWNVDCVVTTYQYGIDGYQL